MRDRLTIALAILAGSIFSASCSQTVPESTVPQPAQEILEVRSNAVGMFDVVGPSLHLRVLNDGSADFEFVDPEKKPEGVAETKDVNIIKSVILSRQETDELVDLLKASAKLSPTETYKRKCCCTDTRLDLNFKIDIDGQKQEIILSNFCDLGDVVNPHSSDREIPRGIRDLYERVNNIRYKYMSL